MHAIEIRSQSSRSLAMVTKRMRTMTSVRLPNRRDFDGICPTNRLTPCMVFDVGRPFIFVTFISCANGCAKLRTKHEIVQFNLSGDQACVRIHRSSHLTVMQLTSIQSSIPSNCVSFSKEIERHTQIEIKVRQVIHIAIRPSFDSLNVETISDWKHNRFVFEFESDTHMRSEN